MIFDLKEFLKNFFSSRLFVLSAVMVLLFGIIFARVFSLQIINGSEYQENFTLLIQKSLPINATRGNIYDYNGKLLAYNQLAYSVVISDNGTYENNDTKNAELNAELAEIIQVIQRNGETIYNDFGIDLNEDGTYSFNVSGTSLNRFRADVFGEASYEDLEYNKEFGFDEANATAEQIIEFLSSDAKECFDIDKSYAQDIRYNIVVIRYAIKGNRFAKYKTTTIAKDVSDKTVAYMNEHADTLTGVSIEEDTIRKYNDSVYFASLLGYTGKISTDEYNKLHEEDESYTTNDTVGKAGLEQYYESYLRGTNGEEEIYVNNVGKITEVISRKDSVAGNDLYLTIDYDLQKATYQLLEQEIAGVLYSNIRKGEIPIDDVYFALINNNVIDLEHFAEEDASKVERQVYKSFASAQKSAVKKVTEQLGAKSVSINHMSEEVLDYFTYVMKLLKDNDILLSKQIDTSDEVYKEWKNGNITPKDYLKHCISKQWIDISSLQVDDKYADSSEIYTALCEYINEEIQKDKDFSKIIYQYMIRAGKVTGKQLCLILFEQSVLDYDDNTVEKIENGTTSAYNFILEKINNIEITPAQLALDPCTGSCVITDIKTGELRALVSYPGYDNNRLANGVDAAYYKSLQEDKSNPQWNYATQEQTAPGSTFKMVTSTAGLVEGVISTTSKIKCTGVFKDVDNHPKCWIYPRGTHGSINVSEAIGDSCNIFYYTTGFKLAQKKNGTYDDATGISYLQKYASIYGLNEKTGLEIVENTPKIATKYPVMAAIGQSDNNFTTVSLSRYVTAVTSGKLYNYQLMSKIVDHNGKTVKKYKSNYKDISDTLSNDKWDAIHKGMRMVCENLDSFDGTKLEVAGKTGTAQQDERPNHALFVGYVPYDNPELSIAVRIAYGYSSHNAASAARNIFEYYYKEKSLEDILALKAAGVNSSSSNSLTD